MKSSLIEHQDVRVVRKLKNTFCEFLKMFCYALKVAMLKGHQNVERFY